MISSSVRRVARPPAAALQLPLLQPRSIALASGKGFHTRRYSSSSKPPVPPSDGSRGFDASSAAHAKGVGATEKKTKRDGEGKEKERRRSAGGNGKVKAGSKQEGVESLNLNLPSVPSTQHLHPHGELAYSYSLWFESRCDEVGILLTILFDDASMVMVDIYVASFFSTHRPISITTSVPPSSTEASFSSIFSSKKQSAASKQSDVIYTLSSAVNAMEKGLPKNNNNEAPMSSAEDIDLRAAVTQASATNAESDVTHLDGVPVQDLRSSIQDFAKNLRPFNPPPPPVPMDSAFEAQDQASRAVESEQSTPKDQSYSTVLTIRESNHADGTKTYKAYTTPFVRVEDLEAPAASQEQDGASRSISEPPTRFLHRMGIRQLRWEDFRDRRRAERMQAISVKRQRKLKMKKHKYRKLMRKTRHLRRKLDKA